MAGSVLAEDADDFPGIEKLMTRQEYEAAGLDKLSKQELEALDAWLVRYTAEDAPAVAKSSEVVKEKQRKFEPITTRIDGKFEGWSGKTEFRLQNGQVWRQRISGKYTYEAENPEVVITRNWAGYFWMKVLETGKSVPVARVQ
jgi:hypothetical protein